MVTCQAVTCAAAAPPRTPTAQEAAAQQAVGQGQQQATSTPAEALAALAVQFDKTPDIVVAEVAGTPISMGLVADRVRGLAPSWGAMPARQVFDVALSGLIQNRLLAQKAKGLGLDKTPSVQRQIAFATDTALAAALVHNLGDGKVTPEALRALYAKAYEGKPGPEEVWLRMIATPVESEAREALRQIRQGMDFAHAVETFSQDPSKQNGGDQGYLAADQLPEVLRAVAFGLSVGEMSAAPLLSNGLWYIIEIEGRRQRAQLTFEEALPTLRSELTKDALLAYLKSIQSEADVKVYGPVGTDKDMTARLP